MCLGKTYIQTFRFFLVLCSQCGYIDLGEANFLGGVARVKGVKDFNPEIAKKRFFEIYLDKVRLSVQPLLSFFYRYWITA